MTEPRQRIRHIPVLVADVVQETADTVTLLLDAGDDPRDYKAGQYVSIDPHQFLAIRGYTAFLEDSKGRKEPPRAYSMVSTPDERYLAITVKEEVYDKAGMKYPPLLSPFLVHHPLKGASMEVTGYAGGYYLPEDIANRTDHVVHLCAGSGSVPNVSMIKWGLAHVPGLRQTFIYSNKTWNDVIYRDELARMEAAHPDRLRVIHALTREPETFPYTDRVRRGRVSPDLIREIVGDVARAYFFACGPAITVWEKRAAKAEGREPSPRFMESVHAAMHTLGVAKDHFREEAFG
jgi:ferredoxin-NADP reductase